DAERAGFEAMAVAAYFSGRARLAMAAGDLGEALAALEEGRRRDQAFQRRGRRIGYHAVLLAGLSLENGDFPVVDEVLTELAEAQGRTADALAGYLAAIEQELPPAVRGTAAVGAARCLAALDRVAEAAELVDRAGPLLARWGGWRVAELAQVGERLGLAPADG